MTQPAVSDSNVAGQRGRLEQMWRDLFQKVSDLIDEKLRAIPTTQAVIHTKVLLSDANVKAAFSTPIELIPAAGAQMGVILLGYVLNFDSTVAYVDASGVANWRLQSVGLGTQQDSQPLTSGLNTGGQDCFINMGAQFYFAAGGASAAGINLPGQGLYFALTNNDLTGGASTNGGTIEIWYTRAPVSVS